MDDMNNVVLDAVDFTPDTLLNAVIYGAGGEKIGSIPHVHGMGPASQVVVSVGGFLGCGAKSVMLAATDLVFMRDADSTVQATTSLTKDQLTELAEHRH